jgi:hypothetical protein
MKNILFVFALFFVFTASAQVSPLPGWSSAKVKYWYDSTCIGCQQFEPHIDSTDDGQSGFITFAFVHSEDDTNLVRCKCNIDSTGTCTLYDELWPYAADSAGIVAWMNAHYEKEGTHAWRETLYAEGKIPRTDCCVHWSFLWQGGYNPGALLTGTLEKMDN